MTIEFSLTNRQKDLQAGVRSLAQSIVRPQSLRWDREHAIDEEFLRNLARMASSMGHGGLGTSASLMRQEEEAPADQKEKKPKSQNLTTVIASEEMAWGDAALLL